MHWLFLFVLFSLFFVSSTLALDLEMESSTGSTDQKEWNETRKNQILPQFDSKLKEALKKGKFSSKEQIDKLSELLTQAENHFLQFNLKEMEVKLTELLESIESSAFSPEFSEAFNKAVYLGLLASESPDLSPEFQSKILGLGKTLYSSGNMKRELPESVKQKLSVSTTTKASGLLLPEPLKESAAQKNKSLVSLPDWNSLEEVSDGSLIYLWQISSDTKLKLSLLQVEASSSSLKVILSKDIPLSDENWLPFLKQSIPARYQNNDLFVRIGNKKQQIFSKSMARNQTNPQTKIEAQPATAKAAPSFRANPTNPNEIDWQLDDLEELNAEKEGQNFQILKSPWFWVIAGVVVGGAGFVIYDQTRTKTVSTP